MLNLTDKIIANANILELHYFLKNNLHTMDAIVENRCEYEVLAIIKEVADFYSLQVIIETEPTAEGGIRKWFKLVSKNENETAGITTAIIITLITILLSTPLTKISEKLIDKLFEDTELNELEKEKLKLEIDKLKDEAKFRNSLIEDSNSIKKRRSNFYETLSREKKIDKISFALTNSEKANLQIEKVVGKDDFKKFILVSDDLEPIIMESAEIEIISPVLKKGKYKWMGYFSGEPIIFSMQSNEFKTLVQNAEVEFKNGSSINCVLQIKRKINNEGVEKVVGYDVLVINHYFENDLPIETLEGRKRKQQKEADRNQIDLFGNSDN